MANPTTNFGWVMPTPTDLVTDLPADFEVFGQAVDTAFQYLKGGTTGQILSKTSNTDLAFTWVTTDDANAIQNTIVDAKGDLIAASAADVPARLAVGNNGESLVADSSTATGLRWNPSTAAKNPVLNSSFNVWQRGTSIASTAAAGDYTADRWQIAFGATGRTVTRQLTNDTTNLPNIQYCARVQRNSGQTSTTGLQFGQSFESINSIPLAGKSVTFSFYARAGANYSASSNILSAQFSSGTGTDQNLLTAGYTGSNNVVAANLTLTTTWQRFSYTGTVPITATEVGIQFIHNPTGTAGANDYFEVTGVQLEAGSVATAYAPNGATYQAELAACQRYYIRTTSTGTDSNHGIGLANSTTNAYIQANIAEMRVIPTSIDYANLNVSDSVNNFTFSGLSINSANSTSRLAFLIATGASGMTQFRPMFMRNNGVTSGYLGFSAEL
jgi:hypothetical protein